MQQTRKRCSWKLLYEKDTGKKREGKWTRMKRKSMEKFYGIWDLNIIEFEAICIELRPNRILNIWGTNMTRIWSSTQCIFYNETDYTFDFLNNLACKVLPTFSIILVFSHAITLWYSISTYVYVVVIDSYGFQISEVVRM